MVALEHQRIFRRFRDVHAGARGTVNLNILVNHHTVVCDSFKPCVFFFRSRRVEARRSKPGAEELPLAGSPRGVTARRESAETLAVLPSFINAAGVTIGQCSGG